MRKNYKETRIKVESRTFQIDFWEEYEFGIEFNYVRVSEIILKEVKSHWFTHRTKIREIKCEIDKCWGSANRIGWAMNAIESHLRHEKEKIKERQQVEAFCKGEVNKWQD